MFNKMFLDKEKWPLIKNMETGQIGSHNPDDVLQGKDVNHITLGFYPLTSLKLEWMHDIPIEKVSKRLNAPRILPGIIKSGYIYITSDKGLAKELKMDITTNIDKMRETMEDAKIAANEFKAEADRGKKHFNEQVAEHTEIANQFNKKDDKPLDKRTQRLYDREREDIDD